MSEYRGQEMSWSRDGCTLLAAVRNLIERAHLATRGKGCEDYQPVWLPDLPVGEPAFRVGHDCRRMPKRLTGLDATPVHSMGCMDVYGELFVMSDAPDAAHRVYVAKCHNCKVVFFSSAWDRTDTVENYVEALKARA